MEDLGGFDASDVTPTVFNLSGEIFSESELTILKKGMKFVPTPRNCDNLELKADILTLLYKIKWHFFHQNKNSQNSPAESDLITMTTHGKAPPKPRDQNQLSLCSHIENITPKKTAKPKYNMSDDLYKALNTIINKLDKIVIKEADKGSGVVIMSAGYYDRKIQEMLDDPTYEVVDIDCSSIVKRTKSFATRNKQSLSKNEFEAIIKQEAYMAGFYGLPKIHKSSIIKDATKIQNSEIVHFLEPEDLKFRPIVSCRDCPTRSLSDLLDKLLRPFVNKVKFRIKDTWEFLRKLPSSAAEGDFTVTADISSLYTNIETINGEIAISYYCDKYPQLLPSRFSKTFLIELYNFCQENLFFCYNDLTYRQVKGTGMGRIYAPSLADIKQGYDEVKLEEKIREKFSATLTSYFLCSYCRYLDDIYFRWNICWELELKAVKQIMNSIDNRINYDFESSLDTDDNSGAYLNARVIIRGQTTVTDLYTKRTDTFNYVPFNSSHPRHTLRNIPFSLARLVRGIVSDPVLLQIRMDEMKGRLKAKKYPSRLIDEGIRVALGMSREEILNPTQRPEDQAKTDIFFVSTYNPTIDQPMNEIRPIVDAYNASQTEDKKKIKVRSSNRKSPSLKDILMYRRSKTKGVFKCKDRCILCNKYLHTGPSLTLKDGTILTANERFDCMSRNLLYAGICAGCYDPYMGETGDQINSRFVVHRQQGKIGAKIQAVKADQHFRVCGKNKYKVFPFKRLKKNCTIYRRVVEDHYIKKIKPALNGDSPFQISGWRS